MRSVLTINSANSDDAMTTLARVKSELGITDTTNDALLQIKIDEASDDIEASLGYRPAQETVTETFWREYNDYQAPEYIVLNRTPVTNIASITLNDETVDPSRYRLDDQTGQLYALDSSGYPCGWIIWKDLVINYTGGYIMPAASNSNLPAGIQGACVDLVSSFWAAKGRDPTVKSEDVPGVLTTTYWVGAVGEAGELPPSVVMKLAPFRRVVA